MEIHRWIFDNVKNIVAFGITEGCWTFGIIVYRVSLYGRLYCRSFVSNARCPRGASRLGRLPSAPSHCTLHCHSFPYLTRHEQARYLIVRGPCTARASCFSTFATRRNFRPFRVAIASMETERLG